MYSLEDRHPSVGQIMRFFDSNHLSSVDLRNISRACTDLAEEMLERLPDDPELVVGLRKLVEAKDCFVRLAAVSEDQND